MLRTPLTISVTLPMPPRSAPMLTVFVMTSRMHALHNTHFEYRRRITPASPSPVTMPSRAHIICTATISGNENKAVHRGA